MSWIFILQDKILAKVYIFSSKTKPNYYSALIALSNSARIRDLMCSLVSVSNG